MGKAPSAGLYIHIPFCHHHCLYCDFYSEIASPGDIDRYIMAVCEEAIKRRAEYSGYRYGTIFLGGGTPSILSSLQMKLLFDRIRSFMRFDSDAEITVECNPSSVNRRLLESYRGQGINRISLGVQSFSDTKLRRLGRIHDAKQAVAAFDLIRKAGFDNASIDLIYGLPDQNVADWIADINSAVALGPEHISAYNLIVEDNTPFDELYKIGKLMLPSDSIQSQMYDSLNERLANAGYARYEISNFARPSFACRHNLKYWHLEPYIGLGPAAVSFDGMRRRKNRSDLTAYLQAIDAGMLPPGEIEEMTSEKLRAEYVMLSLRMTEGLSLDMLRTRYEYDLLREKGDILKALESSGHIVVGGDRIRLAEKGLFISDEIIVRLI
jgi:oxygen-independent coproporphyrinogen-3 oxidase